jgi:hypothetical protein
MRKKADATGTLHSRMPWSRLDWFAADAACSCLLVQPAVQTSLDPAELAVCSCMDRIVRNDGRCGLAGLAAKCLDGCSYAALSPAIASQRCMVGSVLSVTFARLGFHGDGRALVRHSSYRDCLRQDRSNSELADDSLPDVGQLCSSTEFRSMAAERLMETIVC